jgi:hypothetical protein
MGVAVRSGLRPTTEQRHRLAPWCNGTTEHPGSRGQKAIAPVPKPRSHTQLDPCLPKPAGGSRLNAIPFS